MKKLMVIAALMSAMGAVAQTPALRRLRWLSLDSR